MSQAGGSNTIVSRVDANYYIGIEMSGVSVISCTLSFCARHGKSACSLKIS